MGGWRTYSKRKFNDPPKGCPRRWTLFLYVEEMLAELFKAGPVPGVYVLQLGGHTVYVGISYDMRRRIQCHLRRGMQFDRAKLCYEPNQQEQRYLECRLIHRLAPYYNRLVPNRFTVDYHSRLRRSYRLHSRIIARAQVMEGDGYGG